MTVKLEGQEARLGWYTVAAGTSLVAAGSSHAVIQTFDVNTLLNAGDDALLLDVDGDGNDDLNVQNRTLGIYNGAWQVIYTTDAGTALDSQFPGEGLKITSENYTVPGVGDFSYATAQAPGASIDGTGMFSYFANLSYGGLGPVVPDLDAGPILLGFELAIAAQKHFGWLRLQVDLADNGASTLTVIDGAYETEAGVAIDAGAVPEPASLGLLAAGAVGLAGYRGRRQSA
ncbi:MAG: PEP-CTERM sorting domain-containing protein [Planctomycetota bacterium]